MPGREEGMNPLRALHRVAHGDILYHLALAALYRGAQDDPAVIAILQKGEDLRANKVGEVGAVLLKD